MATFEDTVDKLGKTTDKLDAVADKMAASAKTEDTGAAAAEKQREANMRADKTNTYLESIASTLSGMKGEFESAPKDAGKTGGIFGSIARALGGIGAGIGSGIGGFMKGIGKGAAAAPKFVLAMGGLGLGIGAFMLAIGGSVRLVSTWFPKIAENLKEFEGVNGKNLVQVGLGMAALGVGMGAQGIGGAISAIGDIAGGFAKGIGNLLGVKTGPESIVEKLKFWGSFTVNRKAIEDNAAAMIAYGKAMAIGGGADVLSAAGSLASGAVDGLFSLFGKKAESPIDKMIAFSKVVVDKEAVKNNAEAMTAYSSAIATGTGAQALGAVGSLLGAVGSIGDAFSKLFGGKGFIDTTLDNLRKFSDRKGIVNENITNNAKAMISYLGAMALGAGAQALGAAGSLLGAVGSFGDMFSKAFGGEDNVSSLMTGMKKMSAVAIDRDIISNNADAMVDYARAMMKAPAAAFGNAGGQWGNMLGNIAGGLNRWLGGKEHNPLLDLKKFASIEITEQEGNIIKQNAESLVIYGMGMAKFGATKVVKGGAGLLSGISEAMTFWKKKDADPIQGLKKFTDHWVDISAVENNVAALHAFAQLGTGFKGTDDLEDFAEHMGNNLPKIESLITGASATGVKAFGFRVGSEGFKGLASPDIDYEAARSNIDKLKSLVHVDMSTPSPDQMSGASNTQALWAESLQKSIDGLASAITAVNTGGNVVQTNSTTNLTSEQQSPKKHLLVGTTRSRGLENIDF